MRFAILFIIFFSIFNISAFSSNAINYHLDSLLNTLSNCTELHERIDLMNQIADAYYETVERGVKSELYAKKALELASKANYPTGKGFALHRLGRLEHIKYNYQDALNHYIRALQIGESSKIETLLPLVYNSIGLLYRNMYNYDSAIHFLRVAEQKAIDIGDKRTLANVYLNFSRIEYAKLNFEKEEEYSLKVVELATQLGDNLLLAETYYTIAWRLSFNRAGNVALSYLDMAETLIKESFGDDHPMLFWIYTCIGRYQTEQREFEKAELNFTQALIIATWNFDSNNIEFAQIYAFLGDLYRNKGEYDEALKYYYSANEIFQKKNFNAGHAEVDVLKYKMAKVFLRKKQYKKALLLATENQIHWDKYMAVLSNALIGEIYLESLDYDKSIWYFEESNKNNLIDIPIDYNFNFRKDIYLSESVLLKSLSKLSLIYRIKYEQLKDSDYLKKSLLLSYQCDSLIRITKESQIDIEDNLLYVNNVSHDIYNNAIDVCIYYYNIFKDDNYLNSAYYFLEKSKANSLLENYNMYNLVSNEEKEFMKSDGYMDQKISLCQSNLISSFKNNDIEKIDYWKKQIFEHYQQKKQILKDYKSINPDYFHLKYNPKILTIKESQALLTDDQVLIEYFVSDQDIKVFIINRDSFSFHSLDKSDFTHFLNEFSQSIIDQNRLNFIKYSSSLYNILIEPIENDIKGFKKLIIIPDGILWQVNFDLLVKEGNINSKYYELDYLFKQHSISYSYSSTTLSHIIKSHSAQKKEILAFSLSEKINLSKDHFDFSVFRNVNSELPGSSREVLALSNILNGRFCFGEDANIEIFKQAAPHYSIIHLALHGIIDTENPKLSKLSFRVNNNPSEYEYIHAYELSNLSLNSDLVVLSACNTGSGKIINGEGVMSLGRAFIYSGVKSLLLSMWEVSDMTTPIIMEEFYKGLKKGYSKDEALSKAKLKYLSQADDISSAPIFWGAFYVLGDPSPLELKYNNLNYLYLIIFLFFWTLSYSLFLLFSSTRKSIQIINFERF